MQVTDGHLQYVYIGQEDGNGGQVPVQLLDQLRLGFQRCRDGRGLGGRDTQRAGFGQDNDYEAGFALEVAIPALAPDIVLDLDGDDATNVFAIRRGDGIQRDLRIVGGEHEFHVSPDPGIVDIAQLFAAERQGPIFGVRADAGNLAGLVGGDDELFIADGGIAVPGSKRLIGEAPARGEICPDGVKKLELAPQLRDQLLQHPLGLDLCQPLLVPVSHLRADENADNDDQELDRDRGPVLGAQVFGQPTQDHRIAPRRAL